MARPYFATEPWLFEQIMQAIALSIQQSAVSVQQSAISQETLVQAGLQDFTFIDLGSGKGRVLLMASEYPFNRIIGVEFMPEWHRLAEANIHKFAAASPGAPPIESLCLDARDFAFPAELLVIYMFNPFAEPVFAAIMERLRKSLLKKPRPVFVAYRYLEFESLLEKCDWLEKVAGTKQWAVYRHLPFGGSK
ncbi:MAG TPA: class I SAM-dependent methyltransferase [Candidatus Angelobacter sp.]|nr:class I SAM-dependent methyltransferase [Candidatus Angelobacter sp.]